MATEKQSRSVCKISTTPDSEILYTCISGHEHSQGSRIASVHTTTAATMTCVKILWENHLPEEEVGVLE